MLRWVPELGTVRNSHALAYHGMIDANISAEFYEQLREIGPVPRLDLVLATNGGLASAARRLALLLHDYTEKLTILVPHRARSAGTLLCLAAHELVLGPLAELGPLDPRMESKGQPAVMSAEDIRAFRGIAEDWFGVTRPEDRLQVLALLAQKVFPGTLGAFYRADRLVRQIAAELLRHQLPDYDGDLVDRLVGGYYSHDHAITRAQARDLGLRVTYPAAEEEALLWHIVQDMGAAHDDDLQSDPDHGDVHRVGVEQGT
jgi:Serine dehydrogenase proteinase